MTKEIFVTMTRPNQFRRIRINSDSIVNKALTAYQFQLEGTLNARSQDKLEIRFPEQIKV